MKIKEKGRKRPPSKAQTAALEAVLKDEIMRLNCNVGKTKYKAFHIKCKENDTDMTQVVNGWIDEYLASE